MKIGGMRFGAINTARAFLALLCIHSLFSSFFSRGAFLPSLLPVELLLMDCEDVFEKQNGVEVNNDVSIEKKVVPAAAPITPETVRGENGDLNSPLTLSPRTPKDAVFDPFAPVNNPRPPNRKTYLHQLRLTVARQLNFHTNASIHRHEDEESLSDEAMFESVYDNLLQIILSNQTEEGILAAAQLSNVVEYDSDDCKTPPPSSLLLREQQLNTCPAAPIKLKPGGKRRDNIQLGLCKKLQF